MRDPLQRVECLEAEFERDIAHRRFIPYIQAHEFEALLFAEPRQFAAAFPGAISQIDNLVSIRSGFPSPEHIDDGFDSAKHLGGGGHHPDEFAALASIVDWGVIDVFRKFTSGPGHYTFWEFVIPRSYERNLGWRIDHMYATESLAERCKWCSVDKAPRELDRPSDHTFVVAEFG